MEVWNTKCDCDYDVDHIPERRRNKWKTGKVETIHDSHGLCYDLVFDDGLKATYNDPELRRAPPEVPPPFFVRAGPRGSGKTLALVKRSAKTGEVIICVNDAAVTKAMSMASNMGLTIPQPYTHSDLGSLGYSHRFLIDDLDILVGSTMRQVKGFTVSTPEDAG